MSNMSDKNTMFLSIMKDDKVFVSDSATIKFYFTNNRSAANYS